MKPEHYHCPFDCEHPQPFTLTGYLTLRAIKVGFRRGKRYCGRCWHKFSEVVEVILCTPETCPDDVLLDPAIASPT